MESQRKRVGVCVCKRKTARECVREEERERESVCACVCVRESVCVCASEQEGGREREDKKRRGISVNGAPVCKAVVNLTTHASSRHAKWHGYASQMPLLTVSRDITPILINNNPFLK